MHNFPLSAGLALVFVLTDLAFAVTTQRTVVDMEKQKRFAALMDKAVKKSFERPDFQYHVSGALRIRMDDGTEFECRAGDVSLLPSGHDAWVVGTEPAVVVDFQGMIDYAKSE